MSRAVILGIDTSAYTTSVALMTPTGCLLSDSRQILTVPSGARGLRQSDAVYQHIRNLPASMESTFAHVPDGSLATVCVSTAPRPVVGSFMPVFMAGSGIARSVAAVAGTPLWEASHQEGHLWAALWSLPETATQALHHEKNLLAVHLSGGTTEALYVQVACQHPELRPTLTLVGDTTDISAGQFIDRVGTALGLPFPSGPHLQKLAEQGSETNLRLPLAITDERISFSGPESAAQRMIQAGVRPEDLAVAVLECIVATMEKWLAFLSQKTNVRHVILAGGVAANTTLRQRLYASKRLASLHLWFADSHYSSDNAVGLAAWGAARMQGCTVLNLPQRGTLLR